MGNFEDHFSSAAADYARFRPGYPSGLFEFLSALTKDHELAWDAGTGTGQSAIHLRDWYDRVVATDASRAQLALAPALTGVDYRIEPAEGTSLRRYSVDLATAAAAAHWFDLDRYHAEVRRVVKPGGVLAVWAYHLPLIHPPVDVIIQKYSSAVLGQYWPKRSRHVLNRYATLPFPYEEIPSPEFHLTAHWSLAELAGFLRSWSAAIAYRTVTGEDPVAEIAAVLMRAWGDPDEIREVRCPLYLRLGRI